jgi:signal transduction histidine kinase
MGGVTIRGQLALAMMAVTLAAIAIMGWVGHEWASRIIAHQLLGGGGLGQARADAVADQITSGVLVLTPVLMAVAILASFAVASRLTRGLGLLSSCARAVRRGNLSRLPPLDGGPAELRELSVAFSTMVVALRESAHFKERFIGILGHDLRNPLTAIRMSGQRLARHAATLSPADARALALINRSAERMERMIGQLLDFARTRQGGTIPLLRTRCDLGTIVRTVLDELQAAHPDRPISLAVLGDVTGLWDADRAAQVASNLLANALQHGDGAPVEVEVVDADAEVVLHVRNQGPVIPAAELPAIFDPYRSGGAGGGRHRGLGLGLYVVREVVRAHGGVVDVRSDVDEGTTFTVRLPRRPLPAEAPEAAARAAGGRGRELAPTPLRTPGPLVEISAG